jgi:FKBP-type peptidyl-prolyl cis-trans isomerase SlyD
MPRSAFPDDMDLEQGMRLLVRDQNTGRPFEVTVSEIRDDGVVLNFNHPLAGQTLHFHVQVADVRPATDEELEHGHVHGPDTH